MLSRPSDALKCATACIAVAVLAVALAGCGGTTTSRVNENGTRNPGLADAPGALTLPAPGELAARLAPPRSASYTPDDLYRDGTSYEDLLPWNRASRTGTRAVLNSNASGPAGDLGDLGYAIWRFSVAGYSGAPKLRPAWSTPPAQNDCVWLGVANFTAQRWDWFGCAPGQAANLGETASYIDGAGNMLVVVLLSGVNAGELLRLRLGDLMPTGQVYVRYQAHAAPLDQELDASYGCGANGAIQSKWDWDTDGDGTFEMTNATDIVDVTYTTVGQVTAAVRITFDEGQVLTYHAPPVHVLGGTWEITTLADPPSSSYTYEMPQIAIVGGRPGVALREYVAPDPEFLPNGMHTVFYYSASDAQATTWSGASVAVSDASRPVQLGDMLEANGAPALCYRDETSQLGYVRAADAAGASWGAPQLIAPEALDTFDASMAIVKGKPAIAYSYQDAFSYRLGYLQADDASGSSWPARQEVKANVINQVSLKAVDDRPAIAFYSLTDDSMMVVHSGNMDGSGGLWNTIASFVGTGGYAALGVVGGRLAFGMQGAEFPGLTAQVQVSSSALGGAPWSNTYITDIPPTGYSISLGGFCLEHSGVCCYQTQGSNTPGLWISYLDLNGNAMDHVQEAVDAGSGVGSNCEMIVSEGVPMIVYEDSNWGSVKLAVLR